MGGLFSHVFVTSDLLKALLSIPLFIFLPYVFGSSIIPSSLIPIKNSTIFFTLSWLVGVIAITFVAIFLESINFLEMNFFVIFILITCIVSSLIRNVYHNKPTLSNNNLFFVDRSKIKKHGSFFLVLFLSLSFPLLIVWGNQFPTSFAGDELRFTLSALKLMDNSFLPQIGPYFPYHSLLQAFASVLFNTHPISFVWSGIFLMYVLFSASMYLFVYYVSGNQSLSIIATIFALSAFYSKTINLSRFVPMTWVYALFPLFLLCVYSFDNWRVFLPKKNLILRLFVVSIFSLPIYYVFCSNIIPGLNYFPVLRLIALVILWLFSFLSLYKIFDPIGSFMVSSLSCGLVFLHHDLALIGVTLIYLIIFLLSVKNYDLNLFHKISYILMFLVLVTTLMFEYFPIPEKYKVSYFGIDVLIKQNILFESYTIFILIFSFIALTYCTIKRLDLILCVSTIVVLALYFVDISFTIRVMIFLTPLLCYFASRFFKDLLWN